MPQYNPDHYKYYPKPKFPAGYPMLTKLMGFSFDMSAEDREVAFSSTANLKALAKSQLPNEAESPSKLKEFFRLFPGMKAKGNRKARRQLSEQAREVISKVTAEKEMSKLEGLSLRCFGVLLKRGDPDLDVQRHGDQAEEKGILAQNRAIKEIINNGTPEERGKLVEEKVRQAMQFMDAFIQRKFTDEFIIQNYEALYDAQDVFTNAQAFLELTKETANPEQRIVVSPEIKEALKQMEFHSTKSNIPLQRARAIANANYELVNHEYMYTTTMAEVERLNRYLGSGENGECTVEQFDLLNTIEPHRDEMGIGNAVDMVAMILEDFAKDPGTPKVRTFNKLGASVDVPFSADSKFTNDVGMLKGYELVYTDTKAVCYRMNHNGVVTRAEPTDILNYMPGEIEASLKVLQDANKGFFIGSKEFDNGLKAMAKLSKDLKKMKFPRVADENMKEQIENTIAACKSYIQKKDPENDGYELINFKNMRERVRYLAIEQAIASCEHQLKVIQQQEEALAIVATVAENQKKEAALKDQQKKEAYGKTIEEFAKNKPVVVQPGKDRVINLHMSIANRLKLFQNANAPSAELIRDAMAEMVVLEMVLQGREPKGEQTVEAGPIEVELNKNYADVIAGVRGNPRFLQMTQNVTKETLEDFVMNHGAKEMARTLLTGAKLQAEVNAQSKELQHNMENEKQNIIPQ